MNCEVVNDVTPIDIFRDLAYQQRSGLLTLYFSNLEYYIRFSNGSIIDAFNNKNKIELLIDRAATVVDLTIIKGEEQDKNKNIYSYAEAYEDIFCRYINKDLYSLLVNSQIEDMLHSIDFFSLLSYDFQPTIPAKEDEFVSPKNVWTLLLNIANDREIKKRWEDLIQKKGYLIKTDKLLFNQNKIYEDILNKCQENGVLAWDIITTLPYSAYLLRKSILSLVDEGHLEICSNNSFLAEEEEIINNEAEDTLDQMLTALDQVEKEDSIANNFDNEENGNLNLVEDTFQEENKDYDKRVYQPSFLQIINNKLLTSHRVVDLLTYLFIIFALILAPLIFNN